MAGWIGLYVDEPDIELLRERLNADPEIVFILPEGPGRWRAVWQVDDAQGQTMLWHVPAGPLPLLARGGEPDTLIEDPFAGWTERRAGRDRTVPYFGPGWPSTLLLKPFPPGWRGLPRAPIPVSGLGWYGRMMGTLAARLNCWHSATKCTSVLAAVTPPAGAATPETGHRLALSASTPPSTPPLQCLHFG